MNIEITRGPIADGSPTETGPTVLRMLLGVQLRRLREVRSITLEEAGETIRASRSKISRLELGRTGFKQRDVADLLTLYGLTDEAERATLLTMAKQANLPGWWHTYSDLVPSWFSSYLGLEQAADVIRSYEVQLVPDLLQTRDYARAVIRLAHQDLTSAEIERHVELRMKRQQILRRPNAPRLWTVIDEAALRRPIGGTAVMRAQFEHLIDVTGLNHVTVQIMPFSAGGHAASGGPITILRMPEQRLPDVVCLKQLASAVYPDKPSDIQRYWHIMNQLVIQAEPSAQTRKMLHQLVNRLPRH
ncbi:helix-turn-helix domain-containing protein [Streptosporangium carneum]|uniref:Transcriptional regulator n=1 Tax=Streptosporangium carneum TaxID=47481 RepID=A0A9W6HXQ9_9ACTN|nr:helix-turn-helix transcriptional regulator [Streptosporangium carneum]GLK07968.1 transcriptional regulator [Streptosporangium carneum]